MANEINYEEVLLDIEARIATLQAAADGIRMMIAQGSGKPTGGAPLGPGSKIAPDAFLQMSIPDAAKKYLTGTRQKQSTQMIIDALETGGLPRSKYSTVYAILRRREKQVGDIINMRGDWALAEWYPNHRKRTKDEPETAEPTGFDINQFVKEGNSKAKAS